MSNDESNILVSICCITYNHAPFIRKALDGFLMQQAPSCVPQGAKMSDWCEILIHDDCSTDGTDEIIKEYAAKYPDLIFPLYEEENQYSKGVKVDFFNYNRAKGKYIAYCEGDDYWTDPNKLQKQVDFMEAHQECNVTFHRYDILRQEEQKWRHDRCDKYFKIGKDSVVLTLPMYFTEWLTQPCTMVHRKGAYLGQDKPYHGYKDQHMIFHLLNKSVGYILNFKGAVYRENKGGVHGRTPILSQAQIAVQVAQELYEYNGKTKILKDNLIRTLDWAIECEKRSEAGNVETLLSYILRRLIVSKSLIITLKRLFKN